MSDDVERMTRELAQVMGIHLEEGEGWTELLAELTDVLEEFGEYDETRWAVVPDDALRDFAAAGLGKNAFRIFENADQQANMLCVTTRRMWRVVQRKDGDA